MNTNLNNESMKTVVETFLLEETVELIYDNEKLTKWNDLVAELGLTGQTSLRQTDKSPIPFMYLKDGMKHVFETLCPRSEPATEFNATPIPVEILDLIALSKREGYFSRIDIRYDDKNPDPVCLGVCEKWVLHVPGTYNEIKDIPLFRSKQEAEEYIGAEDVKADAYHRSWEDKYYLIGKWADCKRPLSELKEMAKARFLEEEGSRIRKKIKDSQRELDDLENTVITKFS